MSKSPLVYHPAWWVPGAHLQTLWGRIFRRRLRAPTRVERWETPDDDFLDVHRIDRPADAPPGTPHVLLLHGLEGGIHSHYATGLLDEMADRGWGADLLIWRSCGEEPNRAPRFYHSGETGDLRFVLGRIIEEHPDAPIVIAGISLGGNVLLKYLGETGDAVPDAVVAAAAISVPYDLGRGCDNIQHGFSRVYQRYFLDTLRAKALEKQRRYPDLLDPARMTNVRTLREFDDALTAPLHGFVDAQDYYDRSSSIHYLDGIRVPTLLLSARDDPFLPPEVLDRVREIARRNPVLTVEFHARGGHAGFVAGRNPFRPIYYLERRTGDFFADAVREATAASERSTSRRPSPATR
jgi:predicted alpha/beta-fold hydrolase